MSLKPSKGNWVLDNDSSPSKVILTFGKDVFPASFHFKSGKDAILGQYAFSEPTKKWEKKASTVLGPFIPTQALVDGFDYKNLKWYQFRNDDRFVYIIKRFMDKKAYEVEQGAYVNLKKSEEKNKCLRCTCGHIFVDSWVLADKAAPETKHYFILMKAYSTDLFEFMITKDEATGYAHSGFVPALRITFGILQSLQACVHRFGHVFMDLKPENVAVQFGVPGKFPYSISLLDFGGIMKIGSPPGDHTPAYMKPSRVGKLSSPVNVDDDIFAAALIGLLILGGTTVMGKWISDKGTQEEKRDKICKQNAVCEHKNSIHVNQKDIKDLLDRYKTQFEKQPAALEFVQVLENVINATAFTLEPSGQNITDICGSLQKIAEKTPESKGACSNACVKYIY